MPRNPASPQPIMRGPQSPWPGGVPVLGPLAVFQWWTAVARATAPLVPAGWMIASSPFHWAPPLWIAALMAGQGMRARGGFAGSTAPALPAPALPALAVPASTKPG